MCENKRFERVVAFATVLIMASIPLKAVGSEDIRDGLRFLVPESMRIGEILETSMPGVYEVMVEGQIYHVSRSGSFLMIGEVYDLDRQVSLKEEKTNQMISSVVDLVPVESMLAYVPDSPKRHVTVFTDVDCGFCRRFHLQVPELLEAGLEVRYLAFPRAGIGSHSYDTIVSVWCADDPNQAMTMAKAGEDIDPRSCENPVESHYEIGRSAGIQGTPTMILDNGMVIPGYVETGELLQRVGLN